MVTQRGKLGALSSGRAVGLALVVVLSLIAAGCRDSQAGRATPTARPVADAADTGGLSISLRPVTTPEAGLQVRFELTGAVLARVRALAVTTRWAGRGALDDLAEVAVEDREGPIPVRREPAEGRLVLARPVIGDRLVARYFAPSVARASVHDVRVDARGASAVGHRFLLLPELNTELDVRLRWDLSDLPGARAAASVGFGADVVARAAPADLMDALYVAGDLRVQEGGFGERIVARDVAGFELDEAMRFGSAALASARRALAASESQPLTIVLLGEPGLGGGHRGVSLHRSFGLWFDGRRPLDAKLKMAIVHEIVHRWVGGAIELTVSTGEDAAWFHEGFTVHYARRIAWELGALTSAEHVDELNELLRAQGKGASQAVTAMHARDAGRTAGYHRGALYALLLEARLRAARTTLDAFMQELLAASLALRQGGAHRPLPVTRLRELLSARLGPEAERLLDQVLDPEAPPVALPADALGPCFGPEPADPTRWKVRSTECKPPRRY